MKMFQKYTFYNFGLFSKMCNCLATLLFELLKQHITSLNSFTAGGKHTHNVQLYVNLVNHSCEFWPFRHCHSDEQAHSLSFTKGKKAQLTSGFYCSYCCHIFTDLDLCVEEAGGSLVFL